MEVAYLHRNKRQNQCGFYWINEVCDEMQYVFLKKKRNTAVASVAIHLALLVAPGLFSSVEMQLLTIPRISSHVNLSLFQFVQHL